MDIAISPAIQNLLSKNAPIAAGVSGGKDSQALAWALSQKLKDYQGPKVLIHSHLGSVEWEDSLPTCQRLADKIGWELLTTSRPSGGMMQRWQSRWESSKRRYQELSTVALVLPWSTASMRFCTSELKSVPIATALKNRFGKTPIISATGIRAEESPNRAKMPISKPNPRLPAGSLDWNPLLHWKVADVWEAISQSQVPAHEAYRLFGSSRVSCRLCILANLHDLNASLTDPKSHQIYQEMCDLELESAFSFQSNRWLSSLAPHLLPNGKERLLAAQEKARLRQEAENWIPKHLQFSKGWPTTVPTYLEAISLAKMRNKICKIYGWTQNAKCLTSDSILDRYQLLYLEKHKPKDPQATQLHLLAA